MKKLLFMVAAFVVASCTGGNQVANDGIEIEVDTLVENAIDSLSLDSISEGDSICLD